MPLFKWIKCLPGDSTNSLWKLLLDMNKQDKKDIQILIVID